MRQKARRKQVEGLDEPVKVLSGDTVRSDPVSEDVIRRSLTVKTGNVVIEVQNIWIRNRNKLFNREGILCILKVLKSNYSLAYCVFTMIYL